jgi:hypothetical protein
MMRQIGYVSSARPHSVARTNIPHPRNQVAEKGSATVLSLSPA